jgi:hypothetical protein
MQGERASDSRCGKSERARERGAYELVLDGRMQWHRNRDDLLICLIVISSN